MNRYNVYSEYLKDRYGGKTYKLPVKLPITCPNRDGAVAYGGCTFCSDSGGSFENLSASLSVQEQLRKNKDYIASRYGAKHFIAYFQNFSNTYMPLDLFQARIKEALEEDLVGLCISTRPDCISQDQYEFLEKVQAQQGIDIIFELGLQSVNNQSLAAMNRGHDLADFIAAARQIKERNFQLCVHMILGLPWDGPEDIISGARILSALAVDEVKIHSLYIPKGTLMAQQYERGEIQLISLEDYVDYVVLFLRHLDPSIKVQRLVGRMPKEETVFCNWDRSWWWIRDRILEKMEAGDFYQGDLLKLGGITKE